MSSILKALKRIEGQSPPPKSFPTPRGPAGGKQAATSNTGRPWRLRRFITVSLVLLVIVGIAIIGFQRRQFLTSKIFPAGSRAAGQKKTNAAEDKSKIFRAKIPSTTVKQAPRRPEPTRPAGKQTKSLPARQLQNRSTGRTLAQKETSRQKLTPSKKSIAGKRTASRKPAVLSPKTREIRTYAKLNDSKIKLQALAWSSDAARRMAVINGRIVREGESMDGYQINQIRQEDVVVSDGRQSWSLEFGLKQ